MMQSKKGFWANLALLAVFTAVPHLYSMVPRELYTPWQVGLFFGGTILGGLIFYIAYYYLLAACFLRKCAFYDFAALFPKEQPFARRFLIKKIALLLGIKVLFLLADQMLLNLAAYYYAAYYLLEAIHWLVAYALLQGFRKGRSLWAACGIAAGLAVVFGAMEMVLVWSYFDAAYQLITANDLVTIMELTSRIKIGEWLSILLNMGYDLLLGAWLLLLTKKNNA